MNSPELKTSTSKDRKGGKDHMIESFWSLLTLSINNNNNHRVIHTLAFRNVLNGIDR